ncbi:MAG: DUF4358 domain-containing protein [Oscillospiraceae bacterium]|jgi:hypothetical protein|nr:DUF4358 domain-containing protein [Oscillospiraceae bacterium]
MVKRKFIPGAIILIALIIAAVMVVFLTSKRQQKISELTPPDQYIAAALADGAFSVPLYAVDKDIGFMLYGLNSGDYSFAEFYLSDGATAEELTYLTAKSAEAYNAALLAVERRRKEQIAECTGYLPAEIPKLENAVTQQAPADLTLSFAVANDRAKLPASLYE